MTKLLKKSIDTLSSSQKNSFKNNEVIVGLGKQQAKCYYITKGLVKVYDLNADGNIKIIAILKKGDMFPLIWGFDNPPETVYYYKAMGQVTATSFETIELKQKLNEDVYFARDAYMAFVYLSWDFMERIKCLQMPYTQEKILRMLPYLVAKIGSKKTDTIYELNYPIRQEEIAQLIGATRESVSAHLSKIEDRSIINRTKSRISIDMKYIPDEYIHKHWFSESQ